jgi:uncharacterized damage-inducible protein DinB
MKEYYIKQIDFEKWSNSLTMEAISKADNPSERSLQLMGHILGGFSIWLSRIQNEKAKVGSWDNLTIEKCRELNDENHTRWSEYLNAAQDSEFERLIPFTFFGEQSKMEINDTIIHLINHSSYHRGQIIISLKGKLEKLPLTTYIAFSRIADLDIVI